MRKAIQYYREFNKDVIVKSSESLPLLAHLITYGD